MTQTTLKLLCEEILEEGVDIFNLSLGIVSKIEEDFYTVIAVMPPDSVFQAGETFELKDTYCRDVVEKGSSIALTELGDKPGLCKHPLYSGLPLEAYISAPIKIEGKIWGTLNFSSMKIQNNQFTQEEIELIESRADIIADKIKKDL
jgi:GAF domain-containing protein